MNRSSQGRSDDRVAMALMARAGLFPVLAWRVTLETFAHPRLVALVVGSLVVVGLSWRRIDRARQVSVAAVASGYWFGRSR